MKGQISVEYLSTILISIILLTAFYGVYSLYLDKRIKRAKTMLELETLRKEINSLCLEDIGNVRKVRLYIPISNPETIYSDYEIGIKKGDQTFTITTRCKINVTGEFSGIFDIVTLERKNGYVEVKIS